MSDLVTLLSIRTGARVRADMVNSQFVTDTELNTYIVNSYKEYYDLIVDAVEDYNLISTNLTISSGYTMPIPSNFYKLRGIDDITDTLNPRTVRKFMFGERNDLILARGLNLIGEISDVKYRLVGANIEILPQDRAQRPYTVWFIPTPTVPVADGDTIDVINGFDEYIIVDAAIKCLIKEEADIRPLQAQKQALRDRIDRMKSNRDQNLPEKVTKVRSRSRYGIMSPYSGEGTF